MKHSGTGLIETDDLILRRFTIEDAVPMYNNWASDPEVTKFLTWPPHKNPEATSEIIQMWLDEYKSDDKYLWAIIVKAETPEPIGNISVVSVHEDYLGAEIGYCMGRKYWGKGIMTKALKAVINYLFDTTDFVRISAKHDIANPGSGKVMEKSGMKYEGTYRQADKNNQGICDCSVYAILKSDKR